MGALLVLAPLSRVPYPILMVLGGLVLSFMPGHPPTCHRYRRQSSCWCVFLPPLLYRRRVRHARLSATWLGEPAARSALLALGLAAVHHRPRGRGRRTVRVPDLPLAGRGRARGASSPPTDRDRRADRSAGRLGAPRRLVVVIVEGESLVNDATALVLYRVAVVAVTTGAFSLWETSGRSTDAVAAS